VVIYREKNVPSWYTIKAEATATNRKKAQTDIYLDQRSDYFLNSLTLTLYIALIILISVQ